MNERLVKLEERSKEEAKIEKRKIDEKKIISLCNKNVYCYVLSLNGVANIDFSGW